MLIILLIEMGFFFLAIGAVVFVVCGAIPVLRRFALSAALWCAVWGPCAVAWILLGGLAVVANGHAMERLKAHPWQLVSGRVAGWSYICVGLAGVLMVATIVAWLHQVLIQRMTFALFRVYTTIVAAAVGSVWGWSLGFWMAGHPVPDGSPIWLAAMGVLIIGFGFAGWRGSRQLRGEAPEGLTWISREEYEGSG